MRRVNVPEAESLLKSGYVYLDVRSVLEFDIGHVAGAYNVPWQEPGPSGSTLNPDFADEVAAVIARGQPLIVGCADGVRSSAAAERLEAYGYAHVCELTPGTDGLRDALGRVRERGLRAAGVPLVTETAVGRSHAEIRVVRRALVQARPPATSDERKRLWSIVGLLPVSVSFYRGPEMRVECAHPLVTRAMGRDVEGSSYEEAFPELMRFGYYDQMRRAYASGEPAVGSEARVTRKGADGRDEPSYWNYSYLPVRGAGGAIEGVVSCHIDVTAEVQARQNLEALTRRYMSLIQATSQTVWTTTPTGETLDDSPTWRALTGQSFEEWTGYGWLSAIHPDDRAHVQAEWAKALAEERLYEVEYRVRTASGDYIWSFARAVPVRDANGQICEWIGTNTDITAQKAAEAARLRAEEERSALLGRETKLRAEAEAANRAKDEFLAMLGHELRNPLAPIVTALELMKLEAAGGRSHEQEREIIERHVRHLGRLVDDLLDVSRITRGRVDLRRERVSLFDVVQRAVEMASPLLEERRHYLSLSVPKQGLEVDADPARLAQVVANLLTNAAKYTEPHGRIGVEAEAVGEQIVLRVRDTGMGITEHRLPHIFEPFVQEPQSLARSHGGLGLGLAIVRSLVELHGGSVEALSGGTGQGSTFVIRLPRASAPAPAREPVRTSTPRPDSARAPRRVLVVDDNEDAATLLAAWLGRQGFEASVANDGFEAITLARSVQPELALLDLGLPVLDGYQLAERLRAEPTLGALKLIAVTGYGQEQDRERTKRAGFHAHLVKPVNLAELAAILEKMA